MSPNLHGGWDNHETYLVHKHLLSDGAWRVREKIAAILKTDYEHPWDGALVLAERMRDEYLAENLSPGGSGGRDARVLRSTLVVWTLQQVNWHQLLGFFADESENAS